MVSLSIPADRIRDRAAKLDPVKVLLYIIAVPFLLLGLTARALWWVVSMAIAAVITGWELGPAAKPVSGRQAARR